MKVNLRRRNVVELYLLKHLQAEVAPELGVMPSILSRAFRGEL